MTYKACLQYLESFVNYERISDWPYKKSIKLERFQHFLERIGSPQQGLRIVHVAGSKGKGSTCVFIANILAAAGYSAGLYTSPHLADFRERIRILKYGDGPKRDTLLSKSAHYAQLSPGDDFSGMIPKAALSRIVNKLKPAITAFNKRSAFGTLTFFEVYTAVALIYFKEQRCDFVVLETGLGGRLDATNACDSIVSVITSISLEHTDKLGSTIAAIAKEKAGIIKPASAQFHMKGVPFRTVPVFVVSSPQHKDALNVIVRRSKQLKASLYLVGTDVLVRPNPDAATFSVKGVLRTYENLRIRLPGEHQRTNAATAIAAIEALSMQGVRIPQTAIAKGLRRTVWPGRCEVLQRSPLLVADGCQNPASAELLAHTVKETFRFRRLILIFGASNDKDISGMLRMLAPIADCVITTRSSNPRATDPAAIKKALAGKRPAIVTQNVTQALCQARALTGPKDLILAAGSLFIVGELREEACCAK